MTGVMLVVAILLAIHSYLVVTREVAQFRKDMNLHAYLLGTVLATSVSDLWNSVGPESADDIIADANRSEQLVRVRLVWFDEAAGDPDAPLVGIENLSAIAGGREVIFPDYSIEGEKYHVSYFPVSIDTARPCALELSQPLAPVYRYTRISIIQKVALFITFLIIGGGLVWWLGIVFVGRPIRELVGQAHAVGQGDLAADNQLERSHDEIGALAKGLNQMVTDLRAARVRLDEETSQRIAAVEQLNHAERLSTIGKLASGLAHELGTPLNVVAGRAKMIADGQVPEAEVVDSASIIRQQAERMTGLIRKLLDFARSESGAKQVGSIATPVEQVVQMLSPLASQRKVTLTVEGEPDPPRVSVNSSQIQQVFSNLIINAVHAMPDGGEVVIRYGRRQAVPPADHAGPEVVFAFAEVVDSGVGISEEDLSRIFAPFYSTKQVGEGTGLGLSIAHGIIREHGGWIAVESEVGKGSTFTVYLPLGESQ
jgi:signal transduction histidine kinase